VLASLGRLEGEVIRLLSNANIGAVNSRNRYGNTPLIGAILGGKATIVKLLLGKGADVNQKDSEGWTPLMYSIVYRPRYEDEIAEELLRRGADVNAVAENGDTALTLASERDAARIVGQLLDKGANRNVRDRYGRTPTMIAEEHGYATILNLLKNASKQKQ
jgi:ankyrin repeat protein